MTVQSSSLHSVKALVEHLLAEKASLGSIVEAGRVSEKTLDSFHAHCRMHPSCARSSARIISQNATFCVYQCGEAGWVHFTIYPLIFAIQYAGLTLQKGVCGSRWFGVLSTRTHNLTPQSHGHRELGQHAHPFFFFQAWVGVI